MTLPTSPPPRDHRHTRHSPKTIALARRMYGDGDAWTPTQIMRYIEAQGIRPVPTEGTVRRWVIPAVAEAHRAANARSMRTSRAAARDRDDVDLETVAAERLARFRVLHDAGMAYASLAVLARVDHGLQWTPDIARYVLRASRMTRAVRRHLLNAEATS